MEKQEEMKSHADLVQVSAWQSCLSGHGSLVPGAPAVQDTVLVTDLQEDGVPLGDSGSRVALHLTPEVPEAGLEEVRHQSILVIAQEGCLWTPGQQNQPVQSLENINPRCVMEGLEHNPMDGSPKNGADYSCLVKQNIKLLSALEELQHRCTSLKEENSLLRKSCFPETEEKVKHLKRKNAELAVIAKRLEERARKLQEANLKVVNAPVAVKGSSLELCKKAFARQRTKDLTEQASALLAKDKQIEALQQECWELQAKLTSGKEGHHCLNLIDFDHLLRESQKEVLRLQRQIALKNFKESLHSSKSSSEGSSSTAAMCLGPSVPMPNACIKDSSKGAQLGKLTLATEVHRKVEPGVLPLGHTCVELENFPLKNALADQEDSQQREQLEFELRKKRKKCENLEHEVRKKHKRCKELELQLEEVQSENVRLAEQNSRLNEKAEWAGQVESENADLKLQVVLVTKERDSAIQTSQGLQTKLENLEQVLKHMRDVAERRQKLEVEHEEALLVLREKQEEVRRLQQAQAEAKREHEGAVQLLEARVRDLEDQCRSQTEQFSLLSQELKHFRLQTGKIDLLTSTLVTCDLPLAPCSSTPQPQGVHWEKDPDVAPASPVLQCTKTTNDEGTGELEPLPQVSDPAPSVTKTPLPSAGASQKPAKKMESQSSSSKSESVQNSPKSCPTPEVDTASEMEELDVDSVSLIPEPGNQGPAKLQVFLARYSYNPFDGPNENPEAELPLTAGEYIYIYGDMDEDGFFEGELMDGRRGLVPSNFVERVSDDDLVTFLPPELNDLTHSSYHEKSFVSTSTSSGEKSDYSAEETSVSPLPGRLEGDQDEPVSHTAVPYPRKLVLIKQLARSIVVGWEPPLLPAGYPEIQSYNIYVDAELWQNVKSGPQTKAIVEKLDLKTKAYRISVQSVTEQGSSDRLRCTFFVGQDVCIAPTLLKVRNITAASAEVTWLPCNSNYNHAVYLNEEECDTIKPGVYWYTFHNLHPNTQYVAKVEARPPKMLWELPLEKHEQKSAVVHFTTPLAGIPDAPLDVQVELGPSPGILVISWLPVTIDAEGSSNGVRVTGYAVYADGRKVMEVTSPTAGSVLVDLSQLQMFQVCQEVSVRTMSVYGESVDSVPAQISSSLLKASSHFSPPQSAVSTNSTSKLLCGESRYSLPVQTPVTYQTAPPFPPQKVSTDAKFTIYTTSSCEGSMDSLPEKMSPCLHPSSPSASSMQVTGTLSSVSDASREEECLTDLSQSASSMFPAGMSEEELTASRNPAVKGSGEDSQAEVMVELFVMKNLELESQTNTSNMKVPVETCQACFAEEWLKESTTERRREGTEKCLSPEPQLSSSSAKLGEDSYRDLGASGSCVQELLGMSPGKKLMKEISRGDSSVTVPRVKREQEEKMSEAGRRQLNILAEHSRSSDLSDILEEEEEELCSDVLEEKWDLKEHCSRENGEKASGNGDPRSQELPGLPSWQTSTRKGSKNLRSQVLKPPISSTDATRNEASEATVKEDSVRIFVALFDYDPVSMSPNPDAAEEELPFKEGQILKVCGDKDADGFYRGECAGKAGYIPCNMVSEVQVENNDMKKQLLKQGYIPPGTSMESVGNGTFSPPPRRLTVPPPKPRRSKKAELGKQENYKSHPTENYRPRSVHKCQDLEAELLVPRSMVAVFDYNPKESSPNADVEGLELSWLTSKAELTFSAGDIITVFGSMDDDGFYYGELNRQRGLVPSNFLEAVSLDGGVSEGLHSKDKDACAVSVESQLNLDGPGDLSANTFEVPPSCPVTGVPSPEQVVFETPESSVLPVQTKKKRGFFFKGKQLFRKLGSSKKN
ncbi:peripheral-type benzodiazepine receptor-associated protein 1 isoform X9 [Alligator mississippiensis]|uniref:peripheral-type benzodiazepine receptor-associated protein 1 isoform X9 n=1 Tax=Alligator mississippiensis TaxID=8496 RepID=UPI002877EC21|nr:peripheral-type benzodiazepine receptor-associated protein 1 isoform X9 [Alligator mississippiensis]